MAELSKKMRMWMVVSGLYLVALLVPLLIDKGNPAIYLILGVPVPLGWGIWWINQGK